MHKRVPTVLLCLAACLCSLSAAQSQITIQLLETFDYPGEGNSTTPHGINGLGQVAGTYVDSSGVTRSFLRLPNGSFPHLPGYREGDRLFIRGINSSLTFCGFFTTFEGNFNAFIGDNYGVSVNVCYDGCDGDSRFFGINDHGDCVGSYHGTHGETLGVGILNSSSIVFNIPGSAGGDANGINNRYQIVGEYYDSPPATTFHGFIRGNNAHLTFPIDHPGSVSTTLLGINDAGAIVGQWIDSAGVGHGMLYRPPDKFVSYDYPGATATSLNDINDAADTICGNYVDSAGLSHGFLARPAK